MSELKIEYLPISELKPYENNAKIHTEEQIEQIKHSIEEFGFNDPIAVWKDNEIIEGHGRLLAAQELGIEVVPIIRLDGLTDEQRRAYMLVHNKLTMNTGFDLGLIEMELARITDIDMSFYGIQAADDIAEDLESFFIPDNTENTQITEFDDNETIIFDVFPTTENRPELLKFLSREGFAYIEK